jgi:hypothetical protein
MVDYMPAGEGVDRSSSMPDGIEFSESFKKTKQFNNLFLRWLSAPVSAWRASEPWSALVEEARKLWGERWGVVRVALLASVISEEDPKGAAQLVSVSEPLMMRIQFAKARAADPKYWADQVLSSTEKHQEVFIAAACMCLATPGVLADIAEAVADLLDGMTNEEFAKVISCASEFGAQQGALAERRGQKVRSGLTSGIRARLTRESGVSPRWATLLANRYPTVAMRIYEVTLQQYAGDDEIVLANCAAWSIEWATDHPRAWPRTLEVLRRAHEGAVFRTPRAWLRQEKEQLVPTEFALEVCSEPVAFPLRVVSACERSLRADAGRHVRPVGDVAHGENWF